MKFTIGGLRDDLVEDLVLGMGSDPVRDQIAEELALACFRHREHFDSELTLLAARHRDHATRPRAPRARLIHTRLASTPPAVKHSASFSERNPAAPQVLRKRASCDPKLCGAVRLIEYTLSDEA